VGIEQVSSELPCLEDQNNNEIICGQDVVMQTWGAVRNEYSGLNFFFSEHGWEDTEETMHRMLGGPIFQIVYVDILTNDQVDLAREYSESYQFTGVFSEASEYSDQFISNEIDDVQNDVEICDDLLLTAQLFQATAELLEIAGNLIPGAGILTAISDALEIAAFVEIITGIVISGETLFSLPDEMEEAVNRIYNPDGLYEKHLAECEPLACRRLDQQIVAELKLQAVAAATNFDSVIIDMEDQISQGNIEEGLQLIPDLMEADVELRNNMRTACAPVYAVARTAKDSLEYFSELYDTLKSDYADAGMERFKNYIYLAFLPTEQSQSMYDAVTSQLNLSVAQNHNLIDQIEETLDSVSILPMPAVVVVSDVQQSVYSLQQEESATIQLQLQNVGGLTAENISLALYTNDAIYVNEADSIFIGSLAPGESTECFTWTAELFSNNYNRGIWTAEIYSDNARTFSYSGNFVASAIATPGTGGKLSDENVYCYPNPFNPETEVANIRYSLSEAADITLKIFDAGGKPVITLLDKAALDAGVEHSTTWDGKNGDNATVANGVYFFVIESSRDDRAVGKIAVLR